MSKRKRIQQVSNEDKYSIMQKHKNGISLGELANEYCLTGSQIEDILLAKNKVLGMYEEIDELVHDWYTRLNSNEAVDENVVQEQACEFAMAKGYLNFEPSVEWMCNWKQRYNVSLDSFERTIQNILVGTTIQRNKRLKPEPETIQITPSYETVDYEKKPIQSVITQDQVLEHLRAIQRFLHACKEPQITHLNDTWKMIEDVLRDVVDSIEET